MIVELKKIPENGCKLEGAEILNIDGTRMVLKVIGDINDVIRSLSGYEVDDIVYERLSLEELFLEYYGDI